MNIAISSRPEADTNNEPLSRRRRPRGLRSFFLLVDTLSSASECGTRAAASTSPLFLQHDISEEYL